MTTRTPPTTGTSSTAAWTSERIRALGTVTTVPIAASIFGLSRSVAYDLIHTDRFPVPVLRFGRRYRIPVAAICQALHLPALDTPPRERLDPPALPRVDQPHEIRGSTTAAPPEPR